MFEFIQHGWCGNENDFCFVMLSFRKFCVIQLLTLSQVTRLEGGSVWEGLL